LMKDPWTARLVNFQHKHYYGLAIFFAGAIPILIASLWGDPLGGLVFAGFSRLIAVWHMTFCINSVAHWRHWGSSQPYSRASTAQDSWAVSLVTFGEGYHNYHHAFPRDYRNGPRWFNFDPSKWIIYWLSLVGLTHELVRVPSERIEAARRAILSTN
jgi:stearoyl-CoA desaturase (delta-9 desaturase)